MSYRKRKMVREGLGNDLYANQERHLATEGLKDTFTKIFGGIFDTPEVRVKKKDAKEMKKITEQGANIDTRKKAEFIRLLTNTFLNDSWLGEQTLKTGPLNFPNMNRLLINGKIESDLVSQIINSHNSHCALLKEFGGKITARAENIDKNWEVYCKIAQSSPDEDDLDSAVAVKARTALDTLLKEGLALTPVNMFKKPRRVLGCREIKYNGKEYVVSEDKLSGEVNALDAAGLKALAQHIVDNIDTMWPLSDDMWWSLGGVDYEGIPDDVDFDFWWEIVCDHDASHEMYYQIFWDDIPDEIDHYHNGKDGWIYNIYPNTLVNFLTTHLG